YGIWAVDQWSKIGLQVTQRVLPTGPWFEAMRSGNFDVTTEGNCQNVVNPLADVGKYLPNSVSSSNYGQFDDPKEVEMYNRQLRELDRPRRRPTCSNSTNTSSTSRFMRSTCCGGRG